MKKTLSILLAATLVCSALPATVMAEGEEKVTLEFAQWWENELPEGKMAEIIANFEEQHPNIEIKLVTNPYSSTHDALVAGAATGTMSDVCGVDGTWIYDLSKMNALLDIDTYVEKEDKFTADDVSCVKVGGTTYMIPVVVYSYHMYANMTLLKEHGITELPTTFDEFLADCEEVNDPDNNVYGWITALSEAYPSSSQDQFMSWVWANQGSMIGDDGSAVFADDQAVADTLEFFKKCYDAGVVNPGIFSMTSSDMQDTFANGYAAFMLTTCSTINTLRASNPDLEFTMGAVPVKDGLEGESGVMYAPWGLGIAANTEHPDEAWEFVSYLLSPEVNTEFAGYANAFPGNTKSEVVSEDEAFANAYKIVQDNYLTNQMQGLPSAEELMKNLTIQSQLAITGDQEITESLTNAQDYWNSIIKE
ncbi:sugar ABC transporter substrate-binding protein [Blautia schinkii]|nr:sugar ABC transporter substrate-binding protein [Blautia schinkii]